MKTLKDLEIELALDWQSLQLLEKTGDRNIAIKAYQLKYELYRKERSWQAVLTLPITILR